MIITDSTLEKVYRSKKASVETMQLKGYELIKEFFIDSSGRGADNEPALTKNQFENELSELLTREGNEKLTSKITSEGQFQVYIGLFKKTGKSQIEKVAGNTYKITTDTGYKIRFHETDIIEFKNDEILLNTGGWKSVTTKSRMNDYLPDRYYVFQLDFNWYVKDKEGARDIDFENNTLILKT